MSETWRVIDEEGAAHEVAVADGRGSPRSWWAQAQRWSIVEVLAPGQPSRAEGVTRG